MAGWLGSASCLFSQKERCDLTSARPHFCPILARLPLWPSYMPDAIGKIRHVDHFGDVTVLHKIMPSKTKTRRFAAIFERSLPCSPSSTLKINVPSND